MPNNQEVILKLIEGRKLCQEFRMRQINYLKSFEADTEKEALDNIKEITARKQETCNHPIALYSVDCDGTHCLSCYKELDDSITMPIIYGPGSYMAEYVSIELIKLLRANPSLTIFDAVELIQANINKIEHFEYDKASKR